MAGASGPCARHRPGQGRRRTPVAAPAVAAPVRPAAAHGRAGADAPESDGADAGGVTRQRAVDREHAEQAGAPRCAGHVQRSANPEAHHASSHGITYLQRDDVASRQNYAELYDEASRIASGLNALGLQRADPVLLQLEENRDLVPAFWGCILGGFVPVPCAVPHEGSERLTIGERIRGTWLALRSPWVVANRAAAAHTRWHSAASDPPLRVALVESLRDHARSDQPPVESRPTATALLLSTSGSTGDPKLVVQTHATVLAQALASIEHNGFHQDDVSLNWFPLHHVGGLLMWHVRDVVMRCHQFLAPIEAVLEDPLRWLDWIDRHRISLTWAPNSAFARVNDLAVEIGRRRWDLSSLRFLLNGGEAIVASQARRFMALLADHGLAPTAMRPAWGMSETCSAATYADDVSAPSDPFVCVGRPIAGLSLRIVNGGGAMVPEGTVGHLEAKGDMVTPGYFENTDANRDAFSADGWFRTGDLARLDEGKLTIVGRQKDVVIVHGVNHSSQEIETAVEKLEIVQPGSAAAVAVRRERDATDRLAVFYSPRAGCDDDLGAFVTTVKQQVLQEVSLPADYVLPIPASDIPRTAIGKIERARLRRRLEEGRLDGVLKSVDVALRSARTIPAWFQRPIWRAKQLRPGRPARPLRWLLFLDGSGLGPALAKLLERRGHTCMTVACGAGYLRLAPRHFQIDPACAEDYQTVVRAVADTEGGIDRVVHVMSCGRRELPPSSVEDLWAAQRFGVQSLLHVVRAVAGVRRASHDVGVTVITRAVANVVPGDEVGVRAGAPARVQPVRLSGASLDGREARRPAGVRRA